MAAAHHWALYHCKAYIPDLWMVCVFAGNSTDRAAKSDIRDPPAFVVFANP